MRNCQGTQVKYLSSFSRLHLCQGTDEVETSTDAYPSHVVCYCQGIRTQSTCLLRSVSSFTTRRLEWKGRGDEVKIVADSRRALLSGDSDEVETSTDICPRSRRNCQGLGSQSRGPYRPRDTALSTPYAVVRGLGWKGKSGLGLSGNLDGEAKAGWEGIAQARGKPIM